MNTQPSLSMGASQARKQWQWAYSAGYLSAIITFIGGFFIKDSSGRIVAGFDPYSVVCCFVSAMLLAALARGIQKKSVLCASILLLLVVANGLLLALDEEEMHGKDLLGSIVASVLLFRGILGIRMLKTMQDETFYR